MTATGQIGSLDPDRVHAVFVVARGLAAEARDRYLSEACAGDACLRAEIDELLTHDAVAATFLSTPVWQSLARATMPDVQPGDTVGGFQIESFLARGGTGIVFVATDREHGGEVALKVTAPVHLGPRARERVLREARAAAAVPHPHLVQVLGWGEDAARGLLYCAMRLVRGPTLADVLDELAAAGVPPPLQVRRDLLERLAEVAAALAALHAAGLVHRDVKPANIVLEACEGGEPLAGSAVLVDLGLVGVAHAPGPASTLWASFDYAAPEQLLGRAVGPATDVFALGVVAHDLLNARRPMSRSRAAAGPLPPLAGTDPKLAAVIGMATELDSDWRYADAAALHRDLRAVLDGGKVAALRVPALVRWLRRIQRAPRAKLRTGMRVIAALASGAALVLVGQQGFTIARARNEATAAWARGDLPALAIALDRQPALASLFIPRAVQRLAAGDPARGDPLERVFALGRRQGWHAGLTLAARFLERDGALAHPDLLRFLVTSLELRSDDATLQLVARLYFERPDTTAAATAASARLRTGLHAALSAASDPGTTMAIAVALSGAGDSSSLAHLIAAARCHAADTTDAGCECLRVTLQAVVLLVRRLSCRDAGVRQLPPQQLHTLRELGNLAVTRIAPGTALDGRMRPTVVGLAVELALAQRGAPAAELLLPQAPHEQWLTLAAAADAQTRARVLAGVDPMPLPPEPQPSEEALRALDLGFGAGLLGDPACDGVLRALAVQGRAPASLAARFEEGRARATSVRRGEDPSATPDADSRLGACLDRAPAFVPVSVRVGNVEQDPSAGVDLCRGPPIVVGVNDRVELCAATLVVDELDDAATFVRLAMPGVSALALDFTAPVAASGRFVLGIDAQKGVRAALPWDGEAALDVLLDDDLVASNVRLHGSTVTDLLLPLCNATHTQHRRLVLRLAATATTTVRLYKVRLLAD